MGVVVTFDYLSWLVDYSEFAALTQPQAQSCFNMATKHHRNDGGGPVQAADEQTYLLGLLTAHFAKIRFGTNGLGPAELVGRISDAAEGSVHVTVEVPQNMPASAGWLTQTTYGYTYWDATKGYRTARYRARPQFVVGGRWPMIGGL